jgi:hypothetical protein
MELVVFQVVSEMVGPFGRDRREEEELSTFEEGV